MQGDSCNAALARVDALLAEVLSLVEAWGLKGVNLDWETGFGCNITCHELLWGPIVKKLRAAGKELAISVDDSDANSGWNKSWGNWSFETQWKYYLLYADVLINMGTYPSTTRNRPAWQHLKPFQCPYHPERTCGVEGQVSDMIKQGANPSYQLQPAIWIDDCLPTGNVTISGWTEDALTDFLRVLDTTGVQILAIWTGGAFIDPLHTVTCPWFIPKVRKWALS